MYTKFFAYAFGAPYNRSSQFYGPSFEKFFWQCFCPIYSGIGPNIPNEANTRAGPYLELEIFRKGGFFLHNINFFHGGGNFFGEINFFKDHF